VNDKSERIWKETALGSPKCNLGIVLAALRKTTKTSVRMAGVSAENRTEHLPNAHIERYRCTKLLGEMTVVFVY
jgi:hypothetical protein